MCEGKLRKTDRIIFIFWGECKSVEKGIAKSFDESAEKIIILRKG
jgi:hypothetical protein